MLKDSETEFSLKFDTKDLADVATRAASSVKCRQHVYDNDDEDAEEIDQDIPYEKTQDEEINVELGWQECYVLMGATVHENFLDLEGVTGVDKLYWDQHCDPSVDVEEARARYDENVISHLLSKCDGADGFFVGSWRKYAFDSSCVKVKQATGKLHIQGNDWVCLAGVLLAEGFGASGVRGEWTRHHRHPVRTLRGRTRGRISFSLGDGDDDGAHSDNSDLFFLK